MGEMANPWTSLFETWMRQKGTLVRNRPTRPMSPTTVKARLSVVKRAMRDLGWLGPKDEVLRDYRDLTPDVLVGYFDMRWPDGVEGNESTWNHYAKGLKKLGEFLHFKASYRGRSIFSEEDLRFVNRNIYTVGETPKDDLVLTDDFLNRYETKFLPWLKERDPRTWSVSAFLFYTAFRIHEAAGMRMGLKEGTVIKKADGSLDVYGKKKKGHVSRDNVTLLPEAEEVLEEWLRMRKDLGVDSPFVFVNSRDGPVPLQGSFNRLLRMRAYESGVFKGTVSTEHGRNGLDPTGELRMIRSHVVGRKAAITINISKGVGDVDGMNFSRHKSFKVYKDHYFKGDSAGVASRIHEARNGKDGTAPHSPEETAMALLGDMTVDEKKALLRALIAEVSM